MRGVTWAEIKPKWCKPFCHLYQTSLNISVSDTSFFSFYPTWEVSPTTDSLYERVGLGGSFTEKSVHSWKVQGQPDSARPALQGQPLFDLAADRTWVQGHGCL